MKKILAVLAIWGTASFAQVTSFEAEGNLESTRHVNCVVVSKLKPKDSPADIAGAALRCFKKGEDDRVVELIIALQTRAAFDTRRVLDATAHGAGSVLALNVANAAGVLWDRRMDAAFERFGETGSERHKQLCQDMLGSAVPGHSPRYMVQHGLDAFSGQTGSSLKEGFDAKAAWQDVLSTYLQCG